MVRNLQILEHVNLVAEFAQSISEMNVFDHGAAPIDIVKAARLIENGTADGAASRPE